jgi:DNA invertase Pin-like site-specific DNA recombinase
MRIGYARVSTAEQSLEAQIDALERAGCDKVFQEKVSTRRDRRPELEALLDYIRDSDTLVVTRLDRIARSVRELIDFMQMLDERGITFVATDQSIDTSNAMGRMFFYVMASIAEFERDMIRERTLAGIAAARARGRLGGRPPKMTPAKIAAARRMYDEKTHTLTEIAQVVGVSRTTVWNHVRMEAR